MQVSFANKFWPALDLNSSPFFSGSGESGGYIRLVNPTFPEANLANASREEIMSALFAHMVMQQSNLAVVLLGKVPEPGTGETVLDIESAKMIIDQLEMLEFKSKGNLSADETHLLQETLTTLRMLFVEVLESGVATQPAAAVDKTPVLEIPTDRKGTSESGEGEQNSKRFVKKFNL